MDRIQLLKARLLEMDDRAIFLERMEMIQKCAEKYKEDTPGIKFGHTLKTLLSNISVVIGKDDLIVGRIPEVVPTEAQEHWFEENRKAFFRVPWFQTTGHLTISWGRLLNEGLQGIRNKTC